MKAFLFITSTLLCCFLNGFAKSPQLQEKSPGCYIGITLPPTDTLPAPVGYVNDFEKLFTSTQQATLDSLITAFEQKTTIQIAVVTIDTAMTTKAGFDNYTLRLLNHWGVGVAGKNNGILIGISKGYRKMRIQNGYGIEKVLTDAETKTIIDTTFIPLFKKGNYFDGTLKGLQAIMNKLD